VIGTQPLQFRSPLPYRCLNTAGVLPYLRSIGGFDQYLGGKPARWRTRECGDGNLNLVFIVRGASGGVVVKQALPYVRMVGESWPLSIRRNHFEQAALREHARWASQFVPAFYHADEAMALIVMEFLQPHIVLRAGFIMARVYPRLGVHLGLFLARTLFNTSGFRLSGSEKKERMSFFLGNVAMCQISEDLIFDEPYFAAPMNRHTSPHLDQVASALTRDTDLKIAVQDMKWRFMNQPECLLHGDLHTGSIMVTADDTRVIDPEFAFYGPMGFDIGVLFANFLMACLAQPGHAAGPEARDEYGAYLLDQLRLIWGTFASEFSKLWGDQAARTDGELCNPRLNLDSPAFSAQTLALWLEQVWDDALGFAGCEMIRRVVGLAHVADFETIVDPDRRAECERRTILIARALLLERSQYRSISAVMAMACVLR
jgi:5-methylthioribose kinase